MELGVVGVPFEVKFLEGEGVTAGSFEGYGAVFGNIDSHGDVIEPGAFGKSLTERKSQGRGLPPMYKMHGFMSRSGFDPVGVWDHMEEDAKGLYVRGRVIGMDTEEGKWTYAQMKEGALRGLSIGFNIPPHGSKAGSGKQGEPKRFLKAINLREVSIVDEPSNARAMVMQMKSRFIDPDDLPSADGTTKRQFETWLREAGGFSREAAKSIASHGFKGADPRDEADEVRNAIKSVFSDLASKLNPVR